jgi:hypothetical protein
VSAACATHICQAAREAHTCWNAHHIHLCSSWMTGQHHGWSLPTVDLAPCKPSRHTLQAPASYTLRAGGTLQPEWLSRMTQRPLRFPVQKALSTLRKRVVS